MAKILFAQNTLFEILSYSFISATVKEHNHETDVVIFYNQNTLLKKIKEFNPDVVGFSCITGEHNYIAHISGVIKQSFPNIIVFVGGPHTTYFPEFINQPNIDAICVGEGEYATLDLLDALEKKEDIKRIPNLWVKDKSGEVFKNEIRHLNDLSNLAFMDRELYRDYPVLHRSETKMFFFGRGCKENCTFCFTSKQKEIYRKKGKYLRQSGASLLIEEIKKVKEAHPQMKTVRMMDDSFTVYKNKLLDFLREFEDLDLDLIASVCLNEIDEEIASALGQSRCRLVYVGIESGNEEHRNQIMSKRLSNEALFTSVALLKRHNIKILAGSIFGYPGDTVESALETLEVNITLNIDYPTFAFFTPYPGTKLTEMALQQNLLNDTYKDEVNLMYDKLCITHPHAKEMYNIYNLAPLVVQMPGLFPLMKYLIKAPENYFYKFLRYSSIYIGSLKREGISFHRLVRHPFNRLFTLIVPKSHKEEGGCPRLYKVG